MIYLRKLRAVGHGLLAYLKLRVHGWRMRLAQRGKFGKLRPHLEAAPAAVEAHMRAGVVHRLVVVDIVDDIRIHVVHAAVGIELAAIPVASLIAAPGIAKTVVHAAIEADIRAPIAAEISIAVVRISPVARCPQRSLIRSLHPRAGYPVISH